MARQHAKFSEPTPGPSHGACQPQTECLSKAGASADTGRSGHTHRRYKDTSSPSAKLSFFPGWKWGKNFKLHLFNAHRYRAPSVSKVHPLHLQNQSSKVKGKVTLTHKAQNARAQSHEIFREGKEWGNLNPVNFQSTWTPPTPTASPRVSSSREGFILFYSAFTLQLLFERNNAWQMVGAQNTLLKTAHATKPGPEFSVTVSINLINIMISTGNVGSLRNSCEELCSKGTGKASWPDRSLTFKVLQ